MKPQRVKLTKISDCENPLHPNHIDSGHVVVGEFVYEPYVGGVFLVAHYDPDNPSMEWHTSQIREIIDDRTFKTRNSIYRWEFIDETKEEPISTDEPNFVPYQKEVLRSKIHNGIVKEADLRYEGSVTIGKAIMKEAGLKPYDRVMVVNIANGARIETYVIEGVYREIKLNGAAARQFDRGDNVIIMQFVTVTVEKENQPNPKPTIVILDGVKNLTKEVK